MINVCVVILYVHLAQSVGERLSIFKLRLNHEFTGLVYVSPLSVNFDWSNAFPKFSSFFVFEIDGSLSGLVDEAPTLV